MLRNSGFALVFQTLNKENGNEFTKEVLKIIKHSQHVWQPEKQNPSSGGWGWRSVARVPADRVLTKPCNHRSPARQWHGRFLPTPDMAAPSVIPALEQEEGRSEIQDLSWLLSSDFERS